MDQKQFSEYFYFGVKCLWKLNVPYGQSICKPEDQIICIQESQNCYLKSVEINFETILWNGRVQKWKEHHHNASSNRAIWMSKVTADYLPERQSKQNGKTDMGLNC